MLKLHIEVNQFAAIWVDENNPNTLFEKDIIVNEHLENKHQVNYYHGYYLTIISV